MSAFILSKRHIDVLVTGLLARGSTKAPDELGALLWRENHASVNARYDETRRTPRYTFKAHIVAPGALAKAIDCYVYQSCEHEGWTGSEARALVLALAAGVLSALGLPADASSDAIPGYADGPWDY